MASDDVRPVDTALVWALHERVVRAWLDVTYYEENEPDGIAAATAERDQAKRELRQALGFTVD